MNKSICILGRQPAIGRAELESLLGAAHVQPIGDAAMGSDLPAADIPFSRLGSTVKLGMVLGSVSNTDWHTLQHELAQLVVAAAQQLSEGKVQLGVSAYGLRASPRQLTAAGLELKKVLRQHNYSVRLVPNQEVALSSAQVLHNHLAGERGLELLLVRHGTQVLVARTIHVQDITAYARRDQGRPKRDARVGMLPPKLAQTIVNLAAGQLESASNNVILDPFCGTGVVLQEALLMGYGAYGTDLEPRMIDYTKTNLAWLAQGATPTLEVGDATTHPWQQSFAAVASETYLGRPLSSWPAPEKLPDIIGTCNIIIQHFLQNLGKQIKPGIRLCLAIPAWRAPNGRVHHLPLLDHMGQIGYNRVSFEHSREADLVYYRPNQLVARELLVIVKK
ncbi:MAG TPA: DNA methyltransferase [Nevskiaceae bacterium]|nr:DNA methyltransferase [Nevskiaceae bacterium]